MVESGRGGRSCRARPGLATVAWGAGRGHDSLGCRRGRAMLCRNIAAGWYLSVQRGRAKTNILRHWVGVMTGPACRIWKDLGESMTKVGLWGIRVIAAALAPFFGTGRPGQAEALPDLQCLSVAAFGLSFEFQCRYLGTESVLPGPQCHTVADLVHFLPLLHRLS